MLHIGHEGCWYKIAWAFLKPIGRNNVTHIDKKVRLQLYKPRKSLKKFERFHACEVSDFKVYLPAYSKFQGFYLFHEKNNPTRTKYIQKTHHLQI